MRPANAVRVLLGRQPAIGRGIAEQRNHPVAIEIRGTKIARRRAVCHALKDTPPLLTAEWSSAAAAVTTTALASGCHLAWSEAERTPRAHADPVTL
jgi:hypothetical protein